MPRDAARFVHDTRYIIDCNAAACEMFRCSRSQIIGLSVSALIVSEDFRGLAKLRMLQWRELKSPMQPFKYKCWRCDGSIFWVSTMTRQIDGGLFETVTREIEA